MVNKKQLKKGLLAISITSALLSMLSATISLYLTSTNDKE